MWIWASFFQFSIRYGHPQAKSIGVKLYLDKWISSCIWQKQMQDTLMVNTLKPNHLVSFQIKLFQNEFKIQNGKPGEEIIHSKQYPALKIVVFNWLSGLKNTNHIISQFLRVTHSVQRGAFFPLPHYLTYQLEDLTADWFELSKEFIGDREAASNVTSHGWRIGACCWQSVSVFSPYDLLYMATWVSSEHGS